MPEGHEVTECRGLAAPVPVHHKDRRLPGSSAQPGALLVHLTQVGSLLYNVSLDLTLSWSRFLQNLAMQYWLCHLLDEVEDSGEGRTLLGPVAALHHRHLLHHCARLKAQPYRPGQDGHENND